MARIIANDLNTRDIAAIEAMLGDGRTEAVVSVRGADRYLVMALAHYQHLRECELEAALAESRADIAAGRFVVESPQAHLARLQSLLAEEDAAAAAPAAPAGAAPKPAPPAKTRARSKPAAATRKLAKG